MRRPYLVAYDIADPRRLRQTHKTLRLYGEHWQESVFFCVLKNIDRVRLEADLLKIINRAHDKLFILDLGPDEATARERFSQLGQNLIEPKHGFLIL